MPRLTRAALRSAVLEDTEEAAQIPLPATPKMERTPLGEITLNQEDEPKIVLAVNLSKPGKKAAKSKDTKTGRKKKDTSNKENGPEIIEDDYQSATSSAVEEACEELIRQDKKGGPVFVLKKILNIL